MSVLNKFDDLVDSDFEEIKNSEHDNETDQSAYKGVGATEPCVQFAGKDIVTKECLSSATTSL